MAAKLLHSLADDNPDLQKQIGCMNGILQIFDRPNMGRRHKDISQSGNSNFNSDSLDADSNYTNDQGSMVEKIGEKDTNGKQVPTKSSKAPSFPPLDCGKVRELALTQPIASPKLGRLSPDLRDFVKDSMHRESRGLCQVSKHKGDSPRSLRLSKSFNDRTNNDLPGDLMESLKLLARLKEAPWYEARAGYPLPTTKDASRYSYDGREMNNLASNQRIKDLPRFSLDSRESSMRASPYDLNLSYISKSVEDEDDWSNERARSSYTNKISRPPSVVAKLMGLETLPDSKPSQDSQFGPTKVAFVEDDGYSREANLVQKSQCSKKEPTSPRWKHGDMRPISSSKCPIEPAPWKYLEGSRSPQNPVLKQLKSPERVSNRSPSVYREVEKRLKDLEFEQSGKDLRALKQILEAMEAKGLLGTAKEEQKACQGSNRNSGFNSASESQKKRAGVSIRTMRTQDSDNAVQGSYSLNRRAIKNQISKESSRDNSASTSSTNRLNSNRNLRVGQTQNSAKAQPASRDGNVSSFKSSSSTSPRLQKKLEFDKRSIPPTPDSGKSRRQSNRQATESLGGSPGGRRRVKPGNDMEATGNVRSVKTSPLPPNEAFKCSDISEIRTNPSSSLNEGCILEEHSFVVPEHPSPISVLDALEYGEDSLSPVKHASHSTEGIGAKISENGCLEGEWEPEDRLYVNRDLGSGFTSEINIKKSSNVDSMTVDKLRRQNSTLNEAKNSNPIHGYVLEILSASGILLNDLNSAFQVPESGHLINPELFFVLEQIKLSNGSLTKLDRKLTFDAVNEILASKLACARPPAEPWLSSSKLAKTTINAQKLLKELCEEIEQLETIERRELSSDDWPDEFRGDMSGVVLDVERSIFRDLVDEVVIGVYVKPRKECRKLF
ncbi:hypothetical protein V2J09_020435 [Rumex salicifolius]